MKPSIDLDGARVLLTGASSGIGRALALQLGARGARLALVARRQTELHDLASAITSRGGAAIVVPGDLSHHEIPHAIAESVLREFRGVDILINNAGVSPLRGIAITGDSDVARLAFETNLWSPLAFIATLTPHMLQQERGVIVNVTSTVQAVPAPYVGYYSASKAALSKATQTLRNELRETPIRVVEVVPGSTDTPLRDLDQLPWRGREPRAVPTVSPDSVATAIVSGIVRGQERVVHPPTSLLPLEVPAVGRLVANIAARMLDPTGAIKDSRAI